MKVTINLDGSVSFEVDSAADALALAKAIQNGASALVEKPKPKTVAEATKTADPLWDEAKKPVKSKSKRPSKELLDMARAAGMTVASYVVWEFLVSREDDRRGVSIGEIAHHFHITNAAAGQRLVSLRKDGFCVRVGSGRYKAATP